MEECEQTVWYLEDEDENMKYSCADSESNTNNGSHLGTVLAQHLRNTRLLTERSLVVLELILKDYQDQVELNLELLSRLQEAEHRTLYDALNPGEVKRRELAIKQEPPPKRAKTFDKEMTKTTLPPQPSPITVPTPAPPITRTRSKAAGSEETKSPVKRERGMTRSQQGGNAAGGSINLKNSDYSEKTEKRVTRNQGSRESQIKTSRGQLAEIPPPTERPSTRSASRVSAKGNLTIPVTTPPTPKVEKPSLPPPPTLKRERATSLTDSGHSTSNSVASASSSNTQKNNNQQPTAQCADTELVWSGVYDFGYSPKDWDDFDIQV